MSATCPSCGVPVVPGYVKCPKCHALLPRVVFRKDTVAAQGGTSLEEPAALPWLPIVIGVLVVGALIAFFALRGGSVTTPSAAAGSDTVAPPVAVAPLPPPVVAPPVIRDQRAERPTTAPPVPQGPPPAAIARALQADLQRQQVFATVSVIGTNLEVRSGSCTDKAVRPTIDTMGESARASGLTRLRCVEQSGAVVFTRDF